MKFPRTQIDRIGQRSAEDRIIRQTCMLKNRMSQERAIQERIKALNNSVPMRTATEERCPNCQSRKISRHWLTELYIGPGCTVDGVGAHCRNCGTRFMITEESLADVLLAIRKEGVLGAGNQVLKCRY